MNAFPFTNAEWAVVRTRLYPSLMPDWPTIRSWGPHLVGLVDVLAGLRARYGDRSAVETQADFVDDDSERIALYRRAADVAAAHGLPTLSIRLSLARYCWTWASRGPASGTLGL